MEGDFFWTISNQTVSITDDSGITNSWYFGAIAAETKQRIDDRKLILRAGSTPVALTIAKYSFWAMKLITRKTNENGRVSEAAHREAAALKAIPVTHRLSRLFLFLSFSVGAILDATEGLLSDFSFSLLELPSTEANAEFVFLS
jgi:hypothetical protein